MNLLERVLTLLQANLSTVVEKADDPEKMLRQLQLDMRNQLVQVKTQIATAIAEGRKLQKRGQEREAEANAWLRKAEQAVQQGNDDAARAALAHYNEMHKQVQRYRQQQQEQEKLVKRMSEVLHRLEAKIAEVDTTIDLLLTRKRNALLQRRVYEALNKSDSPQDKERASKATDAVQEAEARARALAELHKRDLETQLDQITVEQEIEQQLQNIKRQQQSTQDIPLLHEGNPHISPLMPPPPHSSAPARKHPEASPHTNGTGASAPPDASTETKGESNADIERLRRLLEATPRPSSEQEA
jgi:phage shock protein A